jgi:hypothetical protein
MPKRQNKDLSQEMEPKPIPSHICAVSHCAINQLTIVADMLDHAAEDT